MVNKELFMALEMLEKKAKIYKKRGNEGLIAEQKRKIDVLQKNPAGGTMWKNRDVPESGTPAENEALS